MGSTKNSKRKRSAQQGSCGNIILNSTLLGGATLTTLIEHPFERALSVSAESITLVLRGHQPAPWADFLLNPRRLRGSDFLMRWSQGVWSEERLTQAVNDNGRYYAIPYGPSGTAPEREDVRAFELYFERLENAGLGKLKRPDVLIFRRKDEAQINQLVEEVGGLAELPFTPEDAPVMRELLSKAVIAVECENSLWKARQMPGYGKPLKPQRRLGGLPGLAKNTVVPTIIVKEEDRGPLLAWQSQAGVPIHVWHGFYDEAYGISLNRVMEVVEQGLIEPTEQVFQSPGGATTRKKLY